MVGRARTTTKKIKLPSPNINIFFFGNFAFFLYGKVFLYKQAFICFQKIGDFNQFIKMTNNTLNTKNITKNKCKLNIFNM